MHEFAGCDVRDIIASLRDRGLWNDCGDRERPRVMLTHHEAVEFLELLRPDGPWVLTAIVPDGGTETTTARTADEIAEFVAKHNGIRNLYYSVNPTRGSMTKKAAKTDIAAIEYLLSDLDPQPDETPEGAKARYLAALDKFKPEPTAIVDSGNGIQTLYKLVERIELPDPVILVSKKRRAQAGLPNGDSGADRRRREPRQEPDGNAGRHRRYAEHRPHPALARHGQSSEQEEACDGPHCLSDQTDPLQRRNVPAGGFSVERQR